MAHSRRRILTRATSSILLVLLVGMTGIESLRSCPHHEGSGHGTLHLNAEAGSLAAVVAAGLDGASDAPVDPSQDPGPCEHNLGVCETLSVGLVVASDLDRLLAVSGPVAFVPSNPREAVPAADPAFLLPYSIGPPAA